SSWPGPRVPGVAERDREFHPRHPRRTPSGAPPHPPGGRGPPPPATPRIVGFSPLARAPGAPPRRTARALLERPRVGERDGGGADGGRFPPRTHLPGRPRPHAGPSPHGGGRGRPRRRRPPSGGGRGLPRLPC